MAQTRRALGAIPIGFLWVLEIAVVIVVIGFHPTVARYGTRRAVESSLLFLLALLLSWLPIVLRASFRPA